MTRVNCSTPTRRRSIIWVASRNNYRRELGIRPLTFSRQGLSGHIQHIITFEGRQELIIGQLHHVQGQQLFLMAFHQSHSGQVQEPDPDVRIHSAYRREQADAHPQATAAPHRPESLQRADLRRAAPVKRWWPAPSIA